MLASFATSALGGGADLAAGDGQLDGQVLGRDPLGRDADRAHRGDVARRLDPEVGLEERSGEPDRLVRLGRVFVGGQLALARGRRRGPGAAGSRRGPRRTGCRRAAPVRSSRGRAAGRSTPRRSPSPSGSRPADRCRCLDGAAQRHGPCDRRRRSCSGSTSSVTSRQWRGSTPSSVSTAASARDVAERRALAELHPHPGAQLRERVLARRSSRGTSRRRRRCRPGGGGRAHRRGSSGR